jgi:hypothetical protein
VALKGGFGDVRGMHGTLYHFGNVVLNSRYEHGRVGIFQGCNGTYGT